MPYIKYKNFKITSFTYCLFYILIKIIDFKIKNNKKKVEDYEFIFSTMIQARDYCLKKNNTHIFNDKYFKHFLNDCQENSKSKKKNIFIYNPNDKNNNNFLNYVSNYIMDGRKY